MRDSCQLCGLYVAQVARRPNPGVVLDWRSEVRARVGFLRRSFIHAPAEPNYSYTDGQDGLRRLVLRFAPRSWTFAVHDSCWKILLLRLGKSDPTPQDLEQVGQHLVQLLYCLPTDENSMTFAAHDFGGATRTWSGSWDMTHDWLFLWADPSIPCFAPSLPASQSVSGDDDTTTLSNGSVPVDSLSDYFARLPWETVGMIFNSLASSDVCNSRLASRSLAIYAAPTRLPQSFWRSRFQRDREFGFLFSAPQIDAMSRGVDWREMYRAVKAELKDTSDTGYLRNRWRVWNSLGPIIDCLQPLLDQNPQLRLTETQDSLLPPQGCAFGNLVRGCARNDRAEGSTMCGIGSRLLGVSHMILHTKSSGETKAYELRVSFLVFDGTTYICGLRNCTQDGSRLPSEVSRVGLIIPSSEVVLHVEAGSFLRNIRVATTAMGVIGIALTLETGDTYTTLSAGVIDELPPNAGVATLWPEHRRKLVGLAIGLDACKVVSIRLIERSSETKRHARQYQVVPPSSPVHIHYPSEFNAAKAYLSGLERSTQIPPCLLLSMDFGAKDGAQLPSLTRIVAHHDNNENCLRGLSFHYVDGSSRTYGMMDIRASLTRRWTCIEESLAIDGPGGERIKALSYAVKSEIEIGHTRVDCVKMTTNWGRILLFRSCPDAGEDEYTWFEASHVDSLTTVTRFFARTQISTGYIQSLAVYGIDEGSPIDTDPHDEQDHSVPVSDDCRAMAPQSTTSSLCYTTTRLEDIKRVSISCGAPGKTRDASHISGLRFDFYTSTVPTYVGQWFAETASMEFERGDRIVGLTWWQYQEIHRSIPSNQKENAGRLAGIRIEKSGSATGKLEMCLGDRNDLLEYSFLENRYENLHGLIWAFSHQVDYIQPVTHPPSSGEGKALILSGMTCMWPNARFPSKLPWEVMTSDDNRNDSLPLRVSAIHVIFQNAVGIVGIMFEYGGGKVQRSVGCISGDRQSMVLEDGEIPIRIDARTSEYNPTLHVYTNHGQVKHLAPMDSESAQQKGLPTYLTTHMLDGREQGSSPGPDRRDDIAAGVQAQGQGQQAICVGIWVTMNIYAEWEKQSIEAFGPMLLKAI